MPLKAPKILIVGSDYREQGGIGTVLSTYHQQGFMHNKLFLVTHREGPALTRIFLFSSAFFQLLWLFIRYPSLKTLHLHMSERGSIARKAIISSISKLFGKQILLHFHGAEFLKEYQSSPAWLKWFTTTFLNSSDGLLVLSKSWKQDLANVTPNPNIHVVYNPVVMDPERTVRLSETDEPLRLLFLGRFGQRKGIYDLLKAMAQTKNCNVELALHGDGELEQVQQEILALGLQEKVFRGGWIRGDEKHKALLKADVLILPSYNEGLPVAILEALAYGLAVISTPVGGIAEAVHHQTNGLLVSPGDVNGLADAIQALAENRATLNLMKQASLKLCSENFSHQNIFSQLETIYSQYN